jgi:hypothetical protein
MAALSACRYSKFIVACELVGVTAVLPYCLMLLRRCHYCGTGSGLPADDGHWKLPSDKRFKVRVLIPCYKVRHTLALVCCDRKPVQTPIGCCHAHVLTVARCPGSALVI